MYSTAYLLHINKKSLKPLSIYQIFLTYGSLKHHRIANIVSGRIYPKLRQSKNKERPGDWKAK